MEASQQIHMLLLDESPAPSCWDKLRCCFHARSRSRDEKRQSSQKKMTVTFDDDCEIFKDNYGEEEDV